VPTWRVVSALLEAGNINMLSSAERDKIQGIPGVFFLQEHRVNRIELPSFFLVDEGFGGLLNTL